MKHIALLALCAALGCGMSNAQYLCSDKGTEFTFTENYKGDKEISMDYTATVDSVSTDADGIISVIIQEVHKVPDNDLAEMKQSSKYTYNPADGTTIHYLMTGDDYLNMIIDMMVEAARQQGQYPSESDIAELRRQCRTKGEIVLPLPADAADGTAIPKSSLSLTAGPTSIKMYLWEGKYLGKEAVETPAGTYDNCQKVSYVLRTSSQAGNEKQYITSWYAPNIGAVKSILSDKKGNELGSDILKAVNK